MPIELWTCFTIGQLLYILKRAGYAGGNGEFKLFDASTRRFFARNWFPLLMHFLFGTCLMGGLISDPAALVKVLGLLGITVQWTVNITWWIALPLGMGAAPIIDMFIRFRPELKKVVGEIAESGTIRSAEPPSAT